MRYVALIFLIGCLSGCVPAEAKAKVRNKHAELFSYVKRIDDPDPAKKPTQEQNEIIIRSIAKDFESFDRMFNNWKPSSIMGESSLEPAKLGN